MKYLLIAHYASCTLDEPQDLVNSCWVVGEAATETEAVDLASKEIEKFIVEQIEDRFDMSIEDMEEEDVDDLRADYDVSINNISDSSDQMETVATLYKNAGEYFQDLQIEVIKR